MFDATTAFIANGVVTIGAVGMAAFAKYEERRAAMLCAAFLVASWIFGCTCFLKHGPTQWAQSLFTERGFMGWEHLPGGEAVDMWSVVDLLGIITVLTVAIEKPWGILLITLLTAGCVYHAVYWMRLIEWTPYHKVIDLLSFAELAIFYAMGGDGLGNAVVSFGRWCGSYIGGPFASASARKALIRARRDD